MSLTPNRHTRPGTKMVFSELDMFDPRDGKCGNRKQARVKIENREKCLHGAIERKFVVPLVTGNNTDFDNFSEKALSNEAP